MNPKTILCSQSSPCWQKLSSITMLGNKSVKKRFVSGVFFTALAKYSGLVIQIAVTAVLARLLTPEDFGIVALATVLIQFFNTLSEAGLGPAVIQRKELSRSNHDSIFTLSLFVGVGLSLLFFSASGLIAEYYDNEKLRGICKWLSLQILINSLDVVPQSLLLKDERFKILGIRTVVVQFLTGVVSIYAAYTGWGIYSLVISALMSSSLLLFVNYYLRPLKLNFHFGCIKQIASFSVFQFMFNIINYFGRNMDKMLVGKFIGMSQLGYYEKSYRLMILPLNNITFVITPVLHPIFSNFQNDIQSMSEKYFKLLKFIGYIAFPLTALLYFTAEELVLIFFGNQWEPSVPAFRILALTAGLQVINSTSGSIFQAINGTKQLFICGLVSTIVSLIGLLIAVLLFKSIISVAILFDITTVFTVFFSYFVLFRQMQIPYHKLFIIFRQPFLLMLVEFGLMFMFVYICPLSNLFLSLILKTFLIGGLTVIYLLYSGIITKEAIFKFIKR